jgi:hypothetical protein
VIRRLRIGSRDSTHVVDLSWAGWISCQELDRVKALAVDETAINVTFRSGAGKTNMDVTRLADDAELSR